MASYEDKIVILIEAVNKSNQSLDDLKKRIDGLKTGTKDLGTVMKGVALGQVLFSGLTMAKNLILEATKATLKWAGDMEIFTLSISSSLLVGGKYMDALTGKALDSAEAFKEARTQAAGIMQELQAANLQTIATLDQLTRVYMETLPIALNKGFDTGQVKDFTLAVVQAAGAIGLEMDMIAEETRAMLTPSINPRFSRVAVSLGLTNEDIRQNSQNADQLFGFLMGKLKAFQMAGEETQRTWKGVWSNLKDLSLQAGAMATEPIFEAIKSGILELLAGLVRVNEETKKLEWNPSFLSALEDIKKGLAFILDVYNKIKGVSTTKEGINLEGNVRDAERRLAEAQGTSLAESRGSYAVGTIKEGQGWQAVDLAQKQYDEAKKALEFYRLAEAERLRGEAVIKNMMKGKVTDEEKAREIVKSINLASQTFGIDPALLASVIKQESQFNPLAKSSKGAMGLMQITPGTYKDIAKYFESQGIGHLLEGGPYDPQASIYAGAYYLAQQIKAQGGDLDKGLAAYNAGPGAVAKYNGVPPYEETIKYVEKIKENYAKADKVTEESLKRQIEYQGKVRLTPTEMDYRTDEIKNQYKDLGQMLGVRVKTEQAQYEEALAQLEKDKLITGMTDEEYFVKQKDLKSDHFRSLIDVYKNKGDLAQQALQDILTGNIGEQEGKPLVGYEEVPKVTQQFNKEINEAALKIAELQGKMAKEGIVDSTKELSENLKVQKADAESKLKLLEDEGKARKEILAIQEKTGEIDPIDKYYEELSIDKEIAAAKQNVLIVDLSLSTSDAERRQIATEILLLENQIKDAYGLEGKAVGEIVTNSAKLKTERESVLASEQLSLAVLKGEVEEAEKLKRKIQEIELIKKLGTITGKTPEDAATRAAIEAQIKELKALTSGADWFVGFKTALRDITNDIGSSTEQWTRLFKDIGQSIRTSLSDTIFGALKGELTNFDQIWENFRDSGLRAISNFMADSVVKDFTNFLSGKKSEGPTSGLLNVIQDLWKSITSTTSNGTDNMVTEVNDGVTQIVDTFGDSGIVETVGNVWNSVANETGGWLQSMLEAVASWVKQVIAQLMAVKAAGSSSSGWLGWLGSLFGSDTSTSYSDAALANEGLYGLHKGGFIPRYHMGGLTRDEVPIIAKKGEYVLSKEDVDFVNKVKSAGPSININMGGGIAQKPTIVPMGVNVRLDNASSVALQASARSQYMNEQYIIDVVLKDINTRGRLGR